MNFEPNQNNKMHPKDKRNLILFIVLSLLVWWSFEHFVISPRLNAIEAAEKQIEASAPKPATNSAVTSVDNDIKSKDLVLKEVERITIDTKELSGSFPVIGNRIDDISLKNYAVSLEDKTAVTLFSPAGTAHPLYAETGWLSNDTKLNLPNKDTKWTVVGNNKLTPTTPVKMTWNNGAGIEFIKTISIDENFVINVSQDIVNTTQDAIEIYPYTSITRRGLPETNGMVGGYEGPVAYVADKLHEISYGDINDDGTQTFTGLNGWIGFGEKYWLSAILPEQLKQTSFTFKSIPNADHNKTIYQVDARGDKLVIGAGTTVTTKVNIFAGAKQVDTLDAYAENLGVKHFDLAIDFGWLYFLTKPLYFLLDLFYGWVGNFGVAIIMLTFVVRAAVFRLASKSYRSFAGLRKIAPKMAELKVRYGHDKPRMQQELIKLYETEKVNPMAGCFPILLQMPIFFAIYKVMSIAIEMRHAPFFGWIHDLSAPDPLTMFNLFGLLNYDVPSFLMIGPWSVAMFIIMMIQKHLNPPPQDQIQRDIANYMPFIITYVLSGFTVGLVIYWTISNLLSVIQQAIIMRSMGVPIYIFSPDAAKEHVESHARATEEAVARVKAEKAEKANEGKDETK